MGRSTVNQGMLVRWMRMGFAGLAVIACGASANRVQSPRGDTDDAGTNPVTFGPPAHDSGSGTARATDKDIDGIAELVSAGRVNVSLLLNTQIIRAHSTVAQLARLFFAASSHNLLNRGGATKFDPVAGTDWILMCGPSLTRIGRDAVVVKYNASDETIDETVAAIAAANPNAVTPDAGVPDGVTLDRADNGERAYLRAPGKILVIVPPDKDNTFASALKDKGVNPRANPTEALRLVVKDPHRQISLPGAKLPRDFKELRIWIEPHAGGSADVFAEGDCTSEDGAATAAEALTELLRRSNSGIVSAASGGLLNDAKFVVDGKHISAHLAASAEQLDKILQTARLLVEP
jgi:hypothetical protein